ncbi:gamma carbonic anhydrase family protein [Pseudoxanthomonas jiangsuensis]|uniref:gamma carbonic anhydrase family protein n=1 Tax=Pseudoxanthomonas jiangsuensis TaxID=619688 RepID=UPI001390AFF6|nr:gamma carbonic anhydrase family protein [Pseudoxanthomonas jiangsuensis]KAF1693652.1 gamma carbonic anhydrase family protein [Pseudoxanthomonas jiangsuensis]
MQNLRPFLDKRPVLGERVYVDPAASVIGEVELGDDVSVWPGTVIRGDVNFVRIGARSNLQDGTIVHVSHESPYNKGGYPTLVGQGVTVGHGTIIHACTIGDHCLIGMGACVLDGAVIEDEAFIGAGAVVGPGKRVPRGELWVGNPARPARALSAKDIEGLHYSADHYVRLKDRYLGMGA